MKNPSAVQRNLSAPPSPPPPLPHVSSERINLRRTLCDLQVPRLGEVMLLIQDQILRNKNLEAGIVMEELTEPRVGIWRGSGCESWQGSCHLPPFKPRNCLLCTAPLLGGVSRWTPWRQHGVRQRDGHLPLLEK